MLACSQDFKSIPFTISRIQRNTISINTLEFTRQVFKEVFRIKKSILNTLPQILYSGSFVVLFDNNIIK